MWTYLDIQFDKNLTLPASLPHPTQWIKNYSMKTSKKSRKRLIFQIKNVLRKY